MPQTLVITDIRDEKQGLIVRGTLVFTGNYSQVTGEVLNWAAATCSGLAAAQPGIQVTEKALDFEAWGRKVSAFVGYTAGTTRDNGVMRVYSSAGTEISTAAFSAGILADTFDFVAHFRKLI